MTKCKRINGRQVECVALELPNISDCEDDDVLDEDELI